jgi:signal transduction histidine kinase/CheY-like chemotaxis protein
MKRPYIMLLSSGILIFSVLSAWNIWFLAGLLLCILALCYNFYNSRNNAHQALNDELVLQMDLLRDQLEATKDKELHLSAELDRAHKTKRTLLSAMSHEIRTPMNGVIGMANLLQETNLNSEQHEYLATILLCSKNLLIQVNDILVNDMLELSKHDIENIELNKTGFNLRNCIEEVLDVFGGKVAEAGLDLVYRIDEDVPVQLVGDAKRLQQILINLVENAIKFTKEGDILLSVRLLTEENQPPSLLFEVSDTGSGISSDDAGKLFEGFFAIHSLGNGKGLGLAICKKLVGLMGGSIHAEAGPKGSVFSFNIPVNATLQPDNDLGRYSMNGFEGKQVLVVDDNLTSAAMLKQQVEDWKLFAVVAHSGKAALENLSQVSFDLVIADLDMPGMNGIELTQIIKEKYPLTPVILLNPIGDDRYKKQEAIFASVINKPVKQHLLFDHVFAELRHHNEAVVTATPTPKLSVDFSKQYPLRIMIAEDNAVNQQWAIKILAKLGYAVDIADNGKIVLEVVSHEQYDLILMDVQMPEMDGLEATRMIRLCLEEQPVIIAMTANVMQGDRQDCIQAGMDDYISKPVEIGQLMLTLEKWAMLIKEKKELIKG